MLLLLLLLLLRLLRTVVRIYMAPLARGNEADVFVCACVRTPDRPKNAGEKVSNHRNR